MRVLRNEETGELIVELTRRNLQILLDKLNYNVTVDLTPGHPSACAIFRDGVTVHAVEDGDHYADRDPGPMLDNLTGAFV